MEETEYLRLLRRMRNLVGPYSQGYIAGLDRAFLNQREFKEKHPDLAQHKYCLRRKDTWGEGYKHGNAGEEPQPPRGAPKSDQPTKDHIIRVRVTKSQFKAYAEHGGNEWLLGILDPNHQMESESEIEEKPKTTKSQKRATKKPYQNELPIDPGESVPNADSEASDTEKFLPKAEHSAMEDFHAA